MLINNKINDHLQLLYQFIQTTKTKAGTQRALIGRADSSQPIIAALTALWAVLLKEINI